MRRSIATVSLSGTLTEKLEAIAAARFDGVEIFEQDLVIYNGRPQDIRRMVADLGLTIDLYQPFRDFEGVTSAQLQRNLDRAERKFDVMGELGASLVLACSNAAAKVSDDDGLMADQMHAFAERASKRGIRIGYEALAWGTRVNTFDRAWRIVEKAAHPNFGLIVDSYHTLVLPHDWSGLADLPGERIFFVQLADAPRLDMNPLMLSRHFRNLPGQGDFDVPGFMQAVLATGYAGTISLEIFNDDFRAAPPRQTALDGMRSLQFVEEQVRRLDDGAAPARHKRRIQLFDPPAEPELCGVDFVEFAVDQTNSAGLSALLVRMGFALIGQHKSKDVDLYGMGDVRFVLNREHQGFAHSYFLMHGPSVCAIALRCDDAIAAVSRAASYGCQRYEGRVGPTEQNIPSVRAPDGGLFYLTDATPAGRGKFESDFNMLSAPPAGRSFTVDHIAQALPDGQLDSWVLFYRAVFGLTPESSVVLSDPYGLVRARAVSTRNRTLRFPLSLSDSRGTATARSVSAYAGAGVSHIALATDDVFTASARMQADGVDILPIPANYYDDLVARFGLDPEYADRLARHGILYDKVGEASFLHFYTLPFQDRFFFEIVQRLDGYDLYGAPNAPVRMAALALSRPADLLPMLR